MTDKQQDLCKTSLALCIAINDETEHYAEHVLSGRADALSICVGNKRGILYQVNIFFREDYSTPRQIRTDFNAFGCFAHNLIKEENPAAYKRLKD